MKKQGIRNRNMPINRNKDWYSKVKTKPHFDLPLSRKSATSLINSFKNDEKHTFHPFIYFELSKKVKTPLKNGRFKLDNKPRRIFYSSHKDSYIYSYYTSVLEKLYEEKLKLNALSDNVLAYRSGQGCNITMSKGAFDEIDRQKNCVAIAVDITKFFDKINHRNLKNEWRDLLGEALPNDHYRIYKSLTKYSWIDRSKILESLELKSAKNLPKPICSHEDFQSVIQPLIKGYYKKEGIPQGSAMSALLSNIYMFELDKTLKDYAEGLQGYYRRYSDDILLILPCEENAQELIESSIEKVRETLNSRGNKLKLSEKKTVISLFKQGVWDKDYNFSNNNNYNFEEFQYLGFTYNGKRKLLRHSTLSKYWGRVNKSIISSKSIAYTRMLKGIKDHKPKKEYIYENYTHIGSRFNFYNGYLRRSSEIMNEPQIKKQLKGHLEKIDDKFEKNHLSESIKRRLVSKVKNYNKYRKVRRYGNG